MSKIFFKIGSTDFSDAVDIQHYDVNDEPVFDAWTDLNHIEHRTYLRTRLRGTFSLGYASETAYAAALSAIQTALAATGYATCQLWSNNDGTTRTADCFLRLTGAGRWNLKTERQWLTLAVEVYER